jgi:hypothetical protein
MPSRADAVKRVRYTMSNFVLWRRLTETDFNAMHGLASPHGRGGGAMHVALGVRTPDFPIDRFLSATGRSNVTVATAPYTGRHGGGSLTFNSNPTRRGGEWLIRDQFSHRHPAWTAAAGFPSTYDPADPPYVFVFRTGGNFHARFAMASELARFRPADLPEGLLAESKGIRPASTTFLARFQVPTKTLIDILADEAKKGEVAPFDPKNPADGRRRVVAAILQRLGQRQFRRRLLAAYGQRCAITRCSTLWVLEAAHITPYRGVRTNAISNGLLLRADIHTLFDLALISIEPEALKIRVSSRLAGSEYAAFDGRAPSLPRDTVSNPSPAALEEHYSYFPSLIRRPAVPIRRPRLRRTS